MKRLIISGIVLLISVYSFAIQCKDVTKSQNFEFADLVCLGKVTCVDEKEFTFQISENFKGESSSIIKVGIEENSIHPEVGEYWLLYAQGDVKSNIFSASICSWSRKLDFPNGNFTTVPLFSPPPCKECPPLTLEEVSFQIKRQLRQLAKITELNSDIGNFRLQRINNKLLELKQQQDDINLRISQKLNILIGLIFILVLVILLLFRRK